MKQDHLERHSGPHPCMGFHIYIYIVLAMRWPAFIALSNGPCVGLSLIFISPLWTSLFTSKFYFGGNCLFCSNSHVHHSNALGLPLAQKGPPVCFRMGYVCLTVYVICCYEWRYWKPTLFQKFPICKQVTITKERPTKIPCLKFLTQKTSSYTTNPKTLL